VRLDYVAPLRWLRRVVFASAASLVVMDVVASYLAGTNRLRGVTRFFDADFKTNFPSSYKILALLTSTIFLWLITEASRITLDRFSRHWRVLAGVFAFLTLDEMTALHQSFSAMLHKEIGGSGYLKYSWQVVYLAALGLLAAYPIPFLHHLGPRMRVRLLAAAILFGGGSGGGGVHQGSLGKHGVGRDTFVQASRGRLGLCRDDWARHPAATPPRLPHRSGGRSVGETA
jgi:hypothetical protein